MSMCHFSASLTYKATAVSNRLQIKILSGNHEGKQDLLEELPLVLPSSHAPDVSRSIVSQFRASNSFQHLVAFSR